MVVIIILVSSYIEFGIDIAVGMISYPIKRSVVQTKAIKAIQSIAAVAEEQSAGNPEISHALKEIERSTDDIAKALAELTKLSEQATDIGQSVSDSARQMAQSAVDLKDILALFRI